MDYKEVYKSEGVTGRTGRIGIKLLISSSKPYDELDTEINYQIGKKIAEIDDIIRNNILQNDPVVMNEKEEERKGLLACFSQPIYVREIENQYSRDKFSPWFQVYTKKGPIKIGWRKRVINIDWSESDVKIHGNSLFPSEDTTIGETYIHAWGYEKAKEYINTLLK